ncbi:RNA polymerase sigma factor SigM [Knoellia aerolata]|uniref:RNA polymerase sigma factor SigM n=1 Tax=Knoellia aerolata DSM 18566 TaxID=1385519 RepID=A0A0A0JYZ4_9MICO|nr:RNA polymerase sigma factor SigM [Knoellia aerolata]KGN40766.1 RNA polymerase sigma factor SigM [Knoellia aerolata DSM 18566]
MDGLEDAPDRDLMARHVAGDPDAFGEIFRRHRDRLWAVAVRTTGDRELAADGVQDGFVNAFRRAESYRGDAAVSTWLHRIVVNACLDRLRRERDVLRRAGDAADLDIADTHDRHDEAETGMDVRAALARLPEHQRLALVLVDMHGMPVSEAAQTLGVAEGTVKSRCARGRAALAELLGATREPEVRP